MLDHRWLNIEPCRALDSLSHARVLPQFCRHGHHGVHHHQSCMLPSDLHASKVSCIPADGLRSTADLPRILCQAQKTFVSQTRRGMLDASYRSKPLLLVRQHSRSHLHDFCQVLRSRRSLLQLHEAVQNASLPTAGSILQTHISHVSTLCQQLFMEPLFARWRFGSCVVCWCHRGSDSRHM